MKIVGLTGGIGSGKTTVAKFFKELGVPVYNSDKEAKKLMTSSKKVKKAIIALLGENSYQEEGLNKAYIANKIFNDKAILAELNAIVHPAVRKHFLKWAKKQKAPYVIQETAIIFENATQDFYDEIILVTAPEEVRIDRVAKRNGIPPETVLERIKNQWSDDRKIPLSHYVIDNIKLPMTKRKVHCIHNTLVNK